MKYKKLTLSNGIRLILVPVQDNPSVTVVISCECGSENESRNINGISHFLEHMLFKGTPQRPSALIVSSELDSVGAESNAMTSNQVTMYYAKAQKKHWKKLFDVISDIYLNPIFPTTELEKERGVIIQEIQMYKDLPHKYVWNLLSELLYGDTPAGRPVIGSIENVRRFSRKDFLNYHKKHYIPQNTVVVVAGDVDEKAIKEQVKKTLGSINGGHKENKKTFRENQKAPALTLLKKKSDQTHMVMAFRGYKISDKKSIVASVLMSILGAGMSSRLFQRLREEMGACYYVYSYHEAEKDRGLAPIATGIDPKRACEVIEALIDECKKLTKEKVSDAELNKVKDYKVSHLYMGLETTDSLASYYMSEEISGGRIKNPLDREKEIRSVTPDSIMELAKELFTDKNLNLAIIGDIKDESKIKKSLTFK